MNSEDVEGMFGYLEDDAIPAHKRHLVVGSRQHEGDSQKLRPRSCTLTVRHPCPVLPAVDEIGSRFTEPRVQVLRLVCVVSCQERPLAGALPLKHLPLLGGTQQQHKVRCWHKS